MEMGGSGRGKGGEPKEMGNGGEGPLLLFGQIEPCIAKPCSLFLPLSVLSFWP